MRQESINLAFEAMQRFTDGERREVLDSLAKTGIMPAIPVWNWAEFRKEINDAKIFSPFGNVIVDPSCPDDIVIIQAGKEKKVFRVE